jgi:hypothetical protein
MPAEAAGAIPIELELGDPLTPLISPVFLDQLRQTLADRAAARLDALHLPAAAVTVRPSDAAVALQVHVHGTVQPLPTAFVEQHTAPGPSPGKARRGQTTAAISAGQLCDDDGALAARLSDLAWQAIARRPSCLLGPDQAAWLPLPAWLRGPMRGKAAPYPHDLTGYLLDLGVGTPKPDRLATQVARQPDASVDLAEALFEESRVGVVELHLSPEAFRAATGRAPPPSGRVRLSDATIDSRIREQVAFLADSVRSRQGLHLPPVELVSAPDLPDPGCAVRINEHLSLPVRLRPGGGRPRAKAPSSGPSLPPSVVHRLPGRVGRLINARQEGVLSAALEAMQAELDWAAYRLIGRTEVEYMLARLEARLPALVQAALSRFSIAELTRILRALVWEHTPVLDLRAILDGLLCFAWVALDLGRRGVVLDERVVLPAALPPGAADNLPYLLEGARGALSPVQTAGSAKRSLLVLEGSLERRLERFQSSWATGDVPPTSVHTLRDEVQAAVSSATSEVRDHALVTTAGARWIAHALLADNLPHLPVISWHELGPDALRNSTGVIRAQRRRSSAKAAGPSAPGGR